MIIVFTLQKVAFDGAIVLSVHHTLAGAKARAVTHFDLPPTVWSEHDSHGRFWTNPGGTPRLVISEHEIAP